MVVVKYFAVLVLVLLSAQVKSAGFPGKGENVKAKGKAVSGISRIWAIDDGEKIKQDDINNPLATSPSNPVWDGKKISLFGGKNEIVAFQLILQGDNMGAKNVDVKLEKLSNKSFIISNSKSNPDPFDYQGKMIELFTEHYVEVTQRTQPGWFYHRNAKPSDYYLGWVPDPLIPFEAPSGNGGTPFSIQKGKNQAVWVDIWIPRNFPAGLYKGNLRVIMDKKDIRTIPVELQVYNFTLPDESHARNMFFMDPTDVANMHGTPVKSAGYWELETKYRQMAHRHRIDIVTNVPDLDEMNIYHKKYLTGEMYSANNKYDGPGTGIGNSTFSIGVYGSLPGEYKWSRQGWWSGSDAWEEWFIKNAPLVQRHKYYEPDEPFYHNKGKGGVDTIKVQANWTHSNPGPGKNIPGLVTAHHMPELRGYVDFWSLPSHEIFPPMTNYEAFKTEIAAGRKWGFYNGFRPSSGSVIIDADAIEFRVQPWIMWKYKADQYFYWRTTNWNNVDVFVNALNFLGSSKANGDGNMFYPGQDKKYASSDRGLPGPISSIRMKNWRRGSQDYEYLWLLKQAGLEAKAKEIADKVIPRALFDADVSKDIAWSNHGYDYEKYRKQMALLLDGAAEK